MFSSASGVGAWSFLQYLDEKPAVLESKPSITQVASARALFQSKTTKGQETKKEGDELWTKHESAIVTMTPLPWTKNPKGYTGFSTSGKQISLGLQLYD